ncbi:Rogdi leucine zipper containing protein-domain-containing protein [Paraphysoderma sedebokerense]|nr:Rogdi leucine zipper containing protein-domain-containing protein [Paraphysoderma sedebokerense]
MVTTSLEEKDHNVLLLEQAATDAELQWLLQTHFPSLLAELAINLEESLLAVSASDHPVSTAAGQNLVISSTNSDSLKGVVSIDGTQIIRADFQIKLPHLNRGHVLKLSVNHQKPIILEQVQTARNYITAALESLQGYLPPYTKRSFDELCDKLDHSLRHAANTLHDVEETKLFPFKIIHPSHFSADLPEDLIIQFHISNGNLVTTIFHVLLHHESQHHHHGPHHQFGNAMDTLTRKMERQLLHGKLLLQKGGTLGRSSGGAGGTLGRSSGISHMREGSHDAASALSSGSGDKNLIQYVGIHYSP